MRGVWMAVLGLGMVVGTARAQLAPPRFTVDRGSPQSRVLSSDSTEALVAGKAEEALRLADQAVAADPRNAWARYNRAVALSELGETDEAVTEYEAARRSFSAQEAWAKSLAMYGKANALARAGRCVEAKTAYEMYAGYVERADPAAAGMARRYADSCKPR